MYVLLGVASAQVQKGAGCVAAAGVHSPCPLRPACQPLAAFVNPFDPGELPFDPGIRSFDPGKPPWKSTETLAAVGVRRSRRPPLALSGLPPDRRGAF